MKKTNKSINLKILHTLILKFTKKGAMSMIYERYVKEKNTVEKKNPLSNQDLITCIIKTREDLITANNNYEFADGDLIDYYLYQIKATQAKYNYLLKKAKQARFTSKYVRTN